jgi:hypothetical protein
VGEQLHQSVRLVWNKISEDQPINGAPEPGLYMNTLSSVLIQGDEIAFPGYFPFNPGVSIPAGGPQKLLQFYQDQTWLSGAHDVRFWRFFVRVMDDHTFGAFSNALQALSIAANNTTSMNNLVTGTLGASRRQSIPVPSPARRTCRRSRSRHSSARTGTTSSRSMPTTTGASATG